MPVVALWSIKPGVGVSTLASILAVAAADADARDSADPGVLLVDLAGDLPILLALAEHPTVGVSDWLQAAPDDPLDALRRLEVDVAAGVSLLPLGGGELGTDGGDALVAALSDDDRLVIVDCGSLRGLESSSIRLQVAAAADVGWIAIRLCYLSVQAALQSPIDPDGLVIMREPGRVIDIDTVVDATGIPVALSLAVDPIIARLVDTGSLVARVPRGLRRAASRSLRDVA